MAALATRVEDLVSMCKWPDDQKEQRRIDLYYHLSEVFDMRRFIQIETSREGGNLTWEKLVEEAKRQERVGKEYAKFRRENGGSGTPSYGDPALAADAVSRGYNKPQQRSRTPSGGKGGKSQKQCDRCGRRNGCTGERGTCPAWGKECGICRGKNHYKAVCWKAAQIQAGGGAQPKFQKQGKGKSPGKNGKAKAKHAHSIVFKTVPSAKGIVSGLEEGASASNSVTSEPSAPLSLGVQRVNSVLSAGNRKSKASLHTHNVFSCDSIHNTGDGTLDQCQTDTDPSGRLCILADIHVRARTTSRTHYIRVKVDPGADANLNLIGRQIKDSQQYNKSHRVKTQRALVLGERCWGTGTNNEWLDCYITGIDRENRCYQVVFEDTGRCLRRTRSHLRPRGPDFPHISEKFL